MRKIIVVLIALLLVTVPAAADTSPDVTVLSSLARYFPADTTLFAVVRTDDTYIETLDDLLFRLNQNLGGELLPPGMSLADLLNSWSYASTGLSYEQVIAPWLGDSLAAGIVLTPEILMEDMPPVLVAAEVRDRDAAAEFLDWFVMGSGIRPLEREGYTVYATFDGAFLLADDVLLFSNLIHWLVPTFEQDAADTLAANSNFSETLALLPADGYNIAIYMNFEGLIAFGETITEMMGQMPVAPTTPTVQDAIMGAAFGFTLIDERSLVADVATLMDEDLLAAQPGYREVDPVDLDYAGYLPASTQFLILGSSFGPAVTALFDGLDQLGPMLQEALPALLSMPEVAWALEDAAYDFRYFMEDNMPLLRSLGIEELAQLSPEELVATLDLSVIRFGGVLRNQLTSLFAGFTGLHLEDEVLSWMTGTYALYASLIPVDSGLEFSLDAGFLTEVTDSDAATYVVDRLERAATLYRLQSARESLAETNALVLSAPLRFFFPPELSAIAAATPELDFLIATDEDVFVIGSRPGVVYALTGEGDSLDDNTVYAYAADNLFLDDPISVLYIGTGTLVEALPALTDLAANAYNIQMMQFVLSQVESATITSANVEGGQIARMTLTIPEEQPYGRPAMPIGMMPDTREVVVVPVETLPVLGIIATDPQFSKLNAALQTTGLDSLLLTSEAITILAPTNDAFAALLNELGSEAEIILNNPTALEAVLRYHLLEGRVFSDDIVALLEASPQIPTLLNGATIAAISTPSGIMLNDRAYLIITDIFTANGIIHAIDAVLLPPQP